MGGDTQIFWVVDDVQVSGGRILFVCLGTFSHFLYLGLISQICIKNRVRLEPHWLRALLLVGRLPTA